MSKADEVLVPREPTEEILKALQGIGEYDVSGEGNSWQEYQRRNWAMILKAVEKSATPSPVPASGITVEQIDRIQSDVTKARNAGIHDDTLLALCALARRAVSAQEPVYVIFDGPPSHESGRFVEVETKDGKSVSAGKWENYGGKYWRLGPLYAKPTDSGSGG